jgi:hypothetical protein
MYLNQSIVNIGTAVWPALDKVVHALRPRLLVLQIVNQYRGLFSAKVLQRADGHLKLMLYHN